MTRVLVVEADFYKDIAEEMGRGAVAELEANQVEVERISVPGALEIPAAIAIASRRNDGQPAYDGYVALGCVIRGETSHYDYVCGESARGLQDLAVQDGLAIGNGILTVENGEQAWARARVSEKNKGRDAAAAALAMIALKQRYSVA
ncbi:MAG: 6,7-dimethyl-8-ribityllumazine synthase [Rhodospirillaceae bacterium]|jgi:6,7-dimethyl-8-ribityllumazine synthase|nr:6,7-dimethyl-8-ribityllumazine synthase [Rhodospirillaceae bacterium]MBT6136384.1 6,7-dimethyl-8-ribityllumazine synthase [Rhodospirillaceae bacterium]